MPDFWDEQMVGLASSRLNGSPVECDWCKTKVASYAAVKVMCSETDPSDYFWGCEPCWEEKRFG
jgi:hypothetical protein